MDTYSYTIGQPFPEKHYISDCDRAMTRITPHSFEIVITLTTRVRDKNI